MRINKIKVQCLLIWMIVISIEKMVDKNLIVKLVKEVLEKQIKIWDSLAFYKKKHSKVKFQFKIYLLGKILQIL